MFHCKCLLTVCTQADGQVTEFLGEEHPFLEYEKMVLKYKALISELQFEVQKVY